MARRGRPEIPIDENQVRNLAERGWSGRQIAAHFSVDEATIRRKFSAVIEDARQHGAAKLMDILWQRGVKEKSDRILVHLADRILGPVPKKIEAKVDGGSLGIIKEIGESGDEIGESILIKDP